MMFTDIQSLQSFLDGKVLEYNRPSFIETDPICIPHRFAQQQDIEIAGFFAAILAWGQRVTIINKMTDLLQRMDNSPYAFMVNHSDSDLRNLLGFKHRTFNDTDLLYFTAFLKSHYTHFNSLEDAFIPPGDTFNPAYGTNMGGESEVASPVCYAGLSGVTLEKALNYFRSYFFSLEDFPTRTLKHISSPMQKSTCKRLTMFLRWMVRKDDCGVDFGLWSTLQSSQLVCPCDVHVDRVARKLGLITRKQTDWLTALELTKTLLTLDPNDPVKYDFALFGLGVHEKF